jgi:hypothetical protein
LGDHLVKFLRLAIVISALVLWAAPAQATEPDLCLACHGRKLAGGRITLGSLAWSGPVEAETQSLCPGVIRAKQELFLTESRLVRLADALAGQEKRGVRLKGLSAELHRLSDRYHTLLNQPVVSLSGLTASLGGLRGELDRKVQEPLWRLSRARSRLTWLGVILVLFMGLLLAGLIGWRRRLNPPPEPLPMRMAREGRLDWLVKPDYEKQDDQGEERP